MKSAVHEVRSYADVDTLVADADVESIAPNRAAGATTDQDSPDFSWMQTLGVTSPFDGTGIGVVVIDSGVTPSFELADSSGKH